MSGFISGGISTVSPDEKALLVVGSIQRRLNLLLQIQFLHGKTPSSHKYALSTSQLV